MKTKIMLSNRHMHISKEHVEALFGDSYELTVQRPMEGMFAANETVIVAGPKGSVIVRILGPARQETQIELLRSDAYTLGQEIPMRISGDLHDAATVKLIGPRGQIEIPCAIVALRHIHIGYELAANMGITEEDRLILRIDGDRRVVYGNVYPRITGLKDTNIVHLDIEEGNSAGINNGETGEIFKEIVKSEGASEF